MILQQTHLAAAFSPTITSSPSPTTTASPSSQAYKTSNLSIVQQQQAQSHSLLGNQPIICNSQQEQPQNKQQINQVNLQRKRFEDFTAPEEMNNTTGFLDFQSATPSRISASVSSRMMQGMVNAVKMKPAIQAYLHADDPIEAGERTVIIMTSKVAQKSYGTEKR